MICVARKARRVSSKLWHGRKDDEIWASGTPSCQARFGRRRQESLKKASIRDSEKSKYCSSGDRPNPGEPNVRERNIEVIEQRTGSGSDRTSFKRRVRAPRMLFSRAE